MSNSGTIAQTWQWKTCQDDTYLTCSLLADWQHGFFTKSFYPRLPKDLTSIFKASSQAYRVKQVHGSSVLTTPEIDILIAEQNLVNAFPDSDAVMSDRSLESVWAASADCTPILIGDLASSRVCSIHAGWRGTAKKIVVEAINRFIALGSNQADLRIAIGPAISGSVYQVDDYVAVEVGNTIVARSNVGDSQSDAELLDTLRQMPHAPIADDELPGKVRLDVPRVNYIQLTQLGLNPEQIAIAPYCTYQQSDLFFSYRRTGEKQVQWSGILTRD